MQKVFKIRNVLFMSSLYRKESPEHSRICSTEVVEGKLFEVIQKEKVPESV